MALLARESCRGERANQLVRERFADDASPENQNIHVVVLDALVGGVGIVAESRSHSPDLIGRHRCANTAAAYQNTTLTHSCDDRLANECSIVRVVHRNRRVSTEVFDLVSDRREKLPHDDFELQTRVVRCDSHTHPAAEHLEARTVIARRQPAPTERQAELVATP